MIKFNVATDGKELMDSFEEEKPTLNEVSLILLRIEQLKLFLLSKEFESKFEVKSGSFLDEE